MRCKVAIARQASEALIRMRRLSVAGAVHLLPLAGFLEPSPFNNSATEERFLHDFRLAGLPGIARACCAAIAGYLLIGSVDIIFNGWSAVEATRRLFPMALLTAIVALVARGPEVLLRYYKLLLGGLGLTVYVCSVAITHFYRDDDPTAIVNPTALIGLWMIYGFVRLPLRLTLTLCIVAGAVTLFGSRVTNMSDPISRTLIYLIVGNALGLIMARSIEVRERELFRQKRTLEDTHAELNRRSVTAEQASAEKSRLVAAVGHDLRQPMMAATLHLSVLMHRVGSKDLAGVERQAKRVSEAVILLKETLEHLLLAARYEAGVKQVSVQAIPLSKVLEDLASLCGPQVLKDRVELKIRQPREGIVVMTDRQILLGALVNLVSNALKFVRRGATVRSRVVVRASTRHGVCRISVLDNGIGIAASDAEEVWKPFAQVADLNSYHEGGLGLGLYLVRQSFLRVPQHQITFSSNMGRGSHFIVSLPVVSDLDLGGQQPGVVDKDASSFDGAIVLPGAYVLVIEDDSRARDALQALLEEWGVLCSSGANLKEALQAHAATDRRVDAIIADFRLPGQWNGIECIDLARSALGYIPDAILMTAEMDVESLARALPVKTILVGKPFSPSLLYDLLSSAVTSARDGESQLLS